MLQISLLIRRLIKNFCIYDTPYSLLKLFHVLHHGIKERIGQHWFYKMECWGYLYILSVYHG